MTAAQKAMKMWQDAIDAMYEAGSELGFVVSFKKYENDEERNAINEVFRICDKVISVYEREAFEDDEEDEA